MAYRGKFPVKNKNKYKGDHSKVTYRSSWELRYMNFLDLSSHVVCWSSEEVVIPYRCSTDHKMHRYFTDFYVKVKNENGTHTEFIIEVKPNKERTPPRKNKNKKRFIAETMTYIKNQSKWAAAEQWCKTNGMHFKVLDEYDLGIKHRPGAIKRKIKSGQSK